MRVWTQVGVAWWRSACWRRRPRRGLSRPGLRRPRRRRRQQGLADGLTDFNGNGNKDFFNVVAQCPGDPTILAIQSKNQAGVDATGRPPATGRMNTGTEDLRITGLSIWRWGLKVTIGRGQAASGTCSPRATSARSSARTASSARRVAARPATASPCPTPRGGTSPTSTTAGCGGASRARRTSQELQDGGRRRRAQGRVGSGAPWRPSPTTGALRPRPSAAAWSRTAGTGAPRPTR
jgi:hypothetical protein